MPKILLGISIGILLSGIGFTFNERLNIKELKDFYNQSCVALPGQISIMKWVGHTPICHREEELKKHLESIKNWKKFM